MAQLFFEGLEAVEKEILKQGDIADKAIPLMLEAGGKIIVEAQRAEAGRLFGISGRSKGDLQKSIKCRIKRNKDETYSLIVPAGKDRKGIENAEKGFILHYGRTNMQAQPWVDAANAKSVDKAHAAMLEVWEGLNNGN